MLWFSRKMVGQAVEWVPLLLLFGQACIRWSQWQGMVWRSWQRSRQEMVCTGDGTGWQDVVWRGVKDMGARCQAGIGAQDKTLQSRCVGRVLELRLT